MLIALTAILMGLAMARLFVIARADRFLPVQAQGLYPSMAGTLALQVSGLCLVVWRGRMSGGDVIQTLAAGPVQRRWLLGLLALGQAVSVVLLVWLLVIIHVFRLGIQNGFAATLSATYRAGPIVLTVYLISLVVLPPLWEELLVRGWLWTRLRQFWGLWPTALSTGGFWLALHLAEGWRKVVLLLPLVVVLSVARHFCGSTRATVLIHICNNITVLCVGLAASRMS